MSIYKDLLFLHGYVTRPGDLASPASASRGSASSAPVATSRDAHPSTIDAPADDDCPAPARTAWRRGPAPAARPTGGWFPLAAAGAAWPTAPGMWLLSISQRYTW